MFIGADDWPIISQTWPASVSSRNTEHWSQMMQDRIPRLQHFDHGTNCSLRAYYERCNQLVYGSMTPPEYDLGKITAPQVIFEGQLDLMAVPEDVAEQRKRLKPDVLVAEVLFQQYSHMGERRGAGKHSSRCGMHVKPAPPPASRCALPDMLVAARLPQYARKRSQILSGTDRRATCPTWCPSCSATRPAPSDRRRR